MTYAIASFPPEVQICESSIPGYCYGVCARHFIPVGTWIGPYEGVRVSAADFQQGMDTSYMWEVYYLIKTVWFHFIKKLPKFRLFRPSRYVCKMFTVTRLVLVESTSLYLMCGPFDVLINCVPFQNNTDSHSLRKL